MWQIERFIWLSSYGWNITNVQSQGITRLLRGSYLRGCQHFICSKPTLLNIDAFFWFRILSGSSDSLVKSREEMCLRCTGRPDFTGSSGALCAKYRIHLLSGGYLMISPFISRPYTVGALNGSWILQMSSFDSSGTKYLLPLRNIFANSTCSLYLFFSGFGFRHNATLTPAFAVYCN